MLIEQTKMVTMSFERLYLAKESKHDLYVEKCPTKQHQIDGIRFLYKIFVKKKPGLILNDPVGHGKTIQTVLFISAIKPILDRPVLILCAEGKESKWREHFEEWTNIAQEVVIETTNPFKRVSVNSEMKKAFVFVNPMQNISAFSHREWSLLIVDNNTMPREILQSKLTADFKIWVTSEDVKNNLKSLFLPFYKWLYPKEVIDITRFNVKNNSRMEKIEKYIELEAFMEDIILRRNNLFSSSSSYIFKEPNEVTTAPRVTRKNKDVTGTKIKRSKRKTNEVSETLPSKVTKSNNISLLDDLIIEDQTPISKNNEIISNLSNHVENNHKDFDEVHESSNNLDRKNEESIELTMKDDDDDEVNDIPWKYDGDDNSNDSVNLLESMHVISNNEYRNDISDKGYVKLIGIEDDMESKTETKDVVNTKTDLSNQSILQKNIGTGSDNDVSNTVITNNELGNNNNINSNEMQSENLFSTEEITLLNVKEKKEDVKDAGVDKDSDKKTECDSKLSDVELKFKQMEELALSKFKGSILDRMF